MNGGIFCERMRKRNRASKIQKLLNWGILSWIIYNVYKIWVLHGSYRVLVNAFPHLGR